MPNSKPAEPATQPAQPVFQAVAADQVIRGRQSSVDPSFRDEFLRIAATDLHITDWYKVPGDAEKDVKRALGHLRVLAKEVNRRLLLGKLRDGSPAFALGGPPKPRTKSS